MGGLAVGELGGVDGDYQRAGLGRLLEGLRCGGEA